MAGKKKKRLKPSGVPIIVFGREERFKLDPEVEEAAARLGRRKKKKKVGKIIRRLKRR